MNLSITGALEVNPPVWNSAFKIIEAPMSYSNKLLNRHGRWIEIINSSPVTGRQWEHNFNQLWMGLTRCRCRVLKSGTTGLGENLRTTARHLYDKKVTILATTGQVVAYPISWTLTPATIIIDIFAGVIQASVRTCQGASKEEIKSILHKKIIAAPAQQLAYSINNFVAFGPTFLQIAIRVAVTAIVVCSIYAAIFVYVGLPTSTVITVCSTIYSSVFAFGTIKGFAYGVFVHSLLMGDTLYCNAQGMVAKLPKVLIPDGYNIFIESGAVDQFGDKAFDPEEIYAEFKRRYEESRPKSEYDQPQTNREGPYSSDFRALIEKDLSEVKEEDKDPFLTVLREWFTSDKEPYTLFGFNSVAEVNESDLNKAYKKLCMLCHPDRRPPKSKLEATALFKIINTARLDVVERIIKMKS